jgi:hypothetical protein
MSMIRNCFLNNRTWYTSSYRSSRFKPELKLWWNKHRSISMQDNVIEHRSENGTKSDTAVIVRIVYTLLFYSNWYRNNSTSKKNHQAQPHVQRYELKCSRKDTYDVHEILAACMHANLKWLVKRSLLPSISFIQFKLNTSLRHFTRSHNIPIIKSVTFYKTD